MKDTRITDDELQDMIERNRLHEEQYHHTVSAEKRHERLFAPYHVTFNEFRTLTYLLSYPDDSEPSKMADYLLILRVTMTSIIDGLQKRGLVERVPHPSDRRRICVRLLPAGEELTVTLLLEEKRYSERMRDLMDAERVRQYHELAIEFSQAQLTALDDIIKERGDDH